MLSAEQVQSAINSSFEPEHRGTALDILTRTNGFGSRTRIAILALANGSIRELERLADAANEDSRNILYWAEFPEAAGISTKVEMAARYRKMGIPVPPPLES